MNGFVRAMLASVLALVTSSVLAQASYQSITVAEYVDDELNVLTAAGYKNGRIELNEPGSSFIKVHFSDFRPPPGMVVEVRNPSGSESYLYARDVRDDFTFDADLGDNGVTSFYAMSISGDSAIIEVHGKPGFVKSLERSARNRVMVDHYVRGFGLDEHSSTASTKKGGSRIASATSSASRTESTCGVMERYDSVCWAGSDPEAYDRALPVAKITAGLKSCTAWRVGSGNHMFTNNHCVSSQTQVSSMEIWFNYERSTCLGVETETVVKVSGDQLFSTDYTLDYTLFSVSDFAAIESFGNLGLEVREASLGEQIYIPQHGSGDPKQIAIDSDMNVGGVCQVDADNYAGRAEGTDIGYYCDTIGGSSGAPVIVADSHKAIAIHHYGGCYNSGVKMAQIWPKVRRYFDRVVPEGDFDPDNLTPPPNPGDDPEPEPQPDPNPSADFGFACTYLDCQFDGSASQDAEGPLVSYDWSFGDESTGEGMAVNHSFPAGGSYSVTLVVTDSGGNTDSAVKTVTVSAPPAANKAPVAEFFANCVDLSCTFDASGSNDPDGTIVSYTWNFGDESTAEEMALTHSFPGSGSYSVALVVTDSEGSTDSAFETVTVSEPPATNKAPVAAFIASCVDLDCTLDASGSSDPDGTIVSYDWAFGNGSSISGVTINHSFPSEGPYPVTLTVTDNQGASSQLTSTVTVSDPVVPVASIELSGAGFKVKGRKWAELSWIGTEADQVRIFRNGSELVVVENSGSYRDDSVDKPTKSAVYKVCEADIAICSNEVEVSF